MILLLFNVFLLLAVVLILTYPSFFVFEHKEYEQEVFSESITFEKEIEEEENFTVSVCGGDNCVYLSSNGMFENGFVDEKKVYFRVLDEVIPHFEKISGGKNFVSNRAGGFMSWKEDEVLDMKNIFEDVYEAFLSREDTEILLERKDLPGTDGTYADRYIEIDDSKMKLYAWLDGKVAREILLSPAKERYRVFGVFPIVDKGREPLSPANSYMPYWMAFYYSPKQESWYGLHSLIWWYDDNGRKVYEPETHIGVRRSGGCIRMLLEDAKYLYDHYDIADPILIHE